LIPETPNVLPIVIGDPNRGLLPALHTSWLSRVDVVRLPSVVLTRDSLDWLERVDEATFKARFGRLPLESEMGCAAAHLNAYDVLLSSSFTWALIMEDDALILNSEMLHAIVTAVVQHAEPTSRLISLYTEGPIFAESCRFIDSVKLMQLRLEPQGAVAYMIDRAAARQLLSAQSPIASVSDWPLNARQIRYGFVPNVAIAHMTSPDTSLVAPQINRRTLVPTSTRLWMWTAIWYFRHRRYFTGFNDYFRQVLLPRVAYKFWRRN